MCSAKAHTEFQAESHLKVTFVIVLAAKTLIENTTPGFSQTMDYSSLLFFPGGSAVVVN